VANRSISRHRVSLRDVARAVGVSHVAVSLALRDDPRVSESRRLEIRAAAERLGYRPDPMLTSLAAYRQTRRGTSIRSTVAWINQWPDPAVLRRHREFDEFWQGAAATADELGHRLDDIVAGPELSGERVHKILHSRGVRGVLIPPHRDGFMLEGFEWGDFSIVRFGISVPEPRAHVVSNDQLNSALLAYATVRARGYRRIGFVTSRRFDHNTGGNFRAGFLAAQDAAGRTMSRIAPLYLEEPATAKDGDLMRAWLKSANPDAVITSHPALQRLLGQLGVRVPEDLSVAATSVLDGNFDSGIDQNCREIGRVAMRTLAGLIQQNERGIPRHFRRVLVEGTWQDGSSLPNRLGRRNWPMSSGRSRVA
jgi:LacI family transcriptional regulator